MWRNDTHVSDKEFLLAADGELSSRRLGALEAHLQACPDCRRRRGEIENAAREFVQAHRRNLDAVLPPIETSRARFQARLMEASAAPGPNLWQRSIRAVFDHRRPAYAGLLLAAGLLCGIALQDQIVEVGAASVPDAALTPGAMMIVTREDICAGARIDEFPPVPSSLADSVFRNYGIRDPEPRAYEVDYLITPALGGSTDIRNLWPQPYSAGTWNARIKDALEDHLHQLVCGGELELSTAQSDISTNWIAAYKKYFLTEQPLPHHFNFIKDSPWE